MPPGLDSPSRILCGDALEVLKGLPSECVQCCVTSPPYWGLRDYGLEPSVWGADPTCRHEWEGRAHAHQRHGDDGANGHLTGPTPHAQTRFGVSGSRSCVRCGAWEGCLGLEPDTQMYVGHLVEVFREVRRVLRDDGTLWLNLGDTYASGWASARRSRIGNGPGKDRIDRLTGGLKEKDLCGIPWQVALALRADGWYLRTDIVWHKPNGLPESVRDRPTRCHEYLFLLSKRPRYFYDAEAVREPCRSGPSDLRKMAEGKARLSGKSLGHEDALCAASRRTRIGTRRSVGDPSGRNRRNVWEIPTAPFKGAHFATFPPRLVEPCVLAGTSGRGCCPRCGAPWKRIVAEGAPDREWQRACGGDGEGAYRGRATKPYAGTGAQDPGAVKARILAGLKLRETVGWEPTCDCPSADPVPCTVLDPFCGSGTACAVALGHGRRFIGIDRSPEYVRMARRRTGDQQAG